MRTCRNPLNQSKAASLAFLLVLLATAATLDLLGVEAALDSAPGVKWTRQKQSSCRTPTN